MFRKRTYWILGGVAAVVGLGAIALSAVGGAVTGEARRRIRDMFVVGPNCDWIRFKAADGDTVSEEQGRELLDQANEYYLDPMIKAARAAGINTPEAVTIFVLEDLFPVCKGQFPPTSLLDVSKQVVWYVMVSQVQSRMAVKIGRGEVILTGDIR